MTELRYRIGYVDLSVPEGERWERIAARTEVRRAEKEGVRTRLIEGPKQPHDTARCRQLLKALLDSEAVPYDASFDAILENPSTLLFVAELGGAAVSFIAVEPSTKNEAFTEPAAYLALSATDVSARASCPNYLLMWRAFSELQRRNFRYFNLGLLEFTNAPDASVSKVAFFKRKWDILEREERKPVPALRYLYYVTLRRFSWVRRLAYRFRGGASEPARMLPWWDQQASRYGGARDLEEMVRSRAAGIIRAAKPPVTSVLELGCGNGRVLEKLSGAKLRLTGVDYSGAMLGEARRRAPEGGYVQADAADYLHAPAAARYASVITLNTFHNFPGPAAVSRAFSDVPKFLEPGGRFIFDVRNALNPFLSRGYRQNRKRGLDFHPFYPWQVRRWLKRAGLELVSAEPVSYRTLEQAGKASLSPVRRVLYRAYLFLQRSRLLSPYVLYVARKPARRFASVVWGYHEQFYGFSKIQNYHLSVIAQARAAGYETEIFSIAERAAIEKDPHFDGTTPIVRYRNVWQFLAWCWRHRNDTVYANSVTWQNFVLPFICRRAVFMAHDSVERRSFLPRLLQHLALRAYWRVRVVAPGEKRFLAERGIDPEKVHVVPIAVDLDLFRFTERERHDVVHLANITPDYDLPTVLGAFDLARKRCPGVKLHCIGEVRTKDFWPTVEALNLRDGIVMHGRLPHERIAALLPSFLVYCSSVVSSGQSLAAFEAALSGCALCLPEIMQFDSVFAGAALFHPLYDSGRLGENLVSYLLDPERAAADNAKARALIAERYCEPAVRAGLERLFDL